MTNKSILIIEDDHVSGAAIAKILSDSGLQITGPDPASSPDLLSQASENLQDVIEIVAISKREISAKKLLFHHLTNMAKNLLGPLSTLNSLALSGVLVGDNGLKELIPLMKESCEELHKSLYALSTMEGTLRLANCNLLEAVRQSESYYKASLLDSDIRLSINVAESLDVNLPSYLVSLVIANVIDNAKDAILEAEGKAGREIRISGYAENGSIICQVANSGAIDGKDIPHIFKAKYSTKKYSGGLGLPLAAECLAIYNADLTLLDAGPPETIFSFRFETPSTATPTESS
jgi:signal transduction histidine kinase